MGTDLDSQPQMQDWLVQDKGSCRFRQVDSSLPFLLAIMVNSTTATTSRPSRNTAPQIKSLLRNTKEWVSLALNLAGSYLPRIPEEWQRDAVLSEPWLGESFLEWHEEGRRETDDQGILAGDPWG